MEKPYIFCHMLTSIDGKIMGNYMDTPECEAASQVFYNISFGEHPHYRHQGWLSGRVTTDDNFTFYRKPALHEDAAPVPEGDFLTNLGRDMYYVSIDPSGKLGWEGDTLTYETTTAYILEVLTELADNRYKDFLRRLGIPYIICGKDELDYHMAAEKVKRIFGIETLMLGGGGVLNWSFIQAGLCDELSVVIAPAADGSSETPALFETRGNRAKDVAVGFELTHADIMDGSTVWLRYKMKKNQEEM